jgi:peptidoglycan/LPS O-acetylase OafA/YrhL
MRHRLAVAARQKWHPSIRFVPALDGIRGVAVLCVLAAHLAPGRARGMFLGVDLFFVVSGFLITSVLLESASGGGLRAFYSRRIVRLVPALLGGVLLAAVLRPVIGWQQGPFGYDVARALTYTTDLLAPAHHASSLIPTWSLGVEEQFYLLWAPVVVLALARTSARRSVLISLVLVATFAAVRFVLTWRTVGGAYIRPWTSFDQLLVGAALCMAIRAYPAALARWAARSWAVASCVVVAIGVMLAAHTTDDRFLYRGGFTVLGLAVAGVIARVMLPGPSRTRRLLESRPLTWTGRRSYGIYLLQGPLIRAWDALRAPRPVASAIAVALTLAAADASWTFVEAPLLAWHSGRRSPLPAVATARPQPVFGFE